MKRVTAILILMLAAIPVLTGCQSGIGNAGYAATGNVIASSNTENKDTDGIKTTQPADDDLPDDAETLDLSLFPSVLASAKDLNGDGGYLLIGEVPEEDIGIYCDNSEIRDRVFIRYKSHIQSFQQDAWVDPTILPKVEWLDWDNDGKDDLVIEYLRHEGEYFDGESTSPGVVGEYVIYQWDGEKWTDVHFYSQAPNERG